jgi:hypothetical protein
MNKDDFTYWLQGWVELNGGAMPTEVQWEMIKDHLKSCFNKVTRPLNDMPPPSNRLNPTPLKDLVAPFNKDIVPNVYSPDFPKSPFPNTIFC